MSTEFPVDGASGVKALRHARINYVFFATAVLITLSGVSKCLAFAETTEATFSSAILRAALRDVPSDAQIVTFNFGNDIFEIPRNYLMGGSDIPRPNEPGFFTVEVLLPDLAPRTAENQDKFTNLRIGLDVRLIISVHYKMHLAAPEDIIKLSLSASKVDENSFKLTPAGYRLYDLGWEELYTKYIINTGKEFFIDCNPGEMPPNNKSCSVHENLSDNLAMEYYFDKNQQENSYEIDLKIRNLLESFRKVK